MRHLPWPPGQGRPPPRDFTEPSGWRQGPRLEALYQTLSEGIAGTSMASFAELSRQDRMALAHFVQALGIRAPSQPGALAELARGFAAGPETVPARIPVAQACALLCQEFQPAPGLRGWPADPRLREAILDPERAAQTLAGMGGQLLPERIAAQVPENGFAPRVLTWSRERWQELGRALNGVPERDLRTPPA